MEGWHTDDPNGDPTALSFAGLVGAIENARPSLSDAAEIQLYRDWLEANTGRSPFLFGAWFNLGVVLARAGDRANAVIAYRNALALKPDLHPASINLGLSLEALDQTEAALATWERALQPEDARITLLNHRARLLERLGRLQDAEAALRTSLETQPDQPDAIQHWVHIRQRTCAWPVLDPPSTQLTPHSLLKRSGPLGVLALTDDVAIQCATAADWIARKTQTVPAPLSPAGGYSHRRLRIGYLSSDFCRHAMSYLIAELFERHDRARFQIFGYCSSPDDQSDLRRRVTGAFDHFRVIRDLSDEEAARLIRRDEIDVLIDLNGLTSGARVQILRWKPAPVQATYLGFIGPVPLPELDYLFCDDFVIPPRLFAAYRPSPLPIAPIYQANDSKRGLGPSLTREAAGLPDRVFVFCCFSNHYKITAEMFAAWLSILARVPSSILWLAADNQWSAASLHSAAAAARIDPARIIIAPRADPEQYMSRLGLADLFLDTFPYNAGTIASDAIRMKLPLITRCGESFASRMAARLLEAIGATEGISSDLPSYEQTAVRLATDRAAYAAYKQRFAGSAWHATIGDIEGFTRALETTLHRIVQRPVSAPALPTSVAAQVC